MRRLLLALASVAAVCLAPVSGSYQAIHHADPAACGADCPASFASFPYWQYTMTGLGNEAGAVQDGSYNFLGRIGAYGYVMSSDHSGCGAPTCSIRFVPGIGPYADQSYKGTGKVFPYDNVLNMSRLYRALNLPHLIEIEPMQRVEACTGPGVPDACCVSYKMGDGSGSGACAAGITSSLPDLPFVRTAHPADVPLNSDIIHIGLGGAASDTKEWYLECNSDDTRGGLPGAPHACCAGGVEFSSATGYSSTEAAPDFPGQLPEPSDATDSPFGGVGQDCDSAAGYTFLGSIQGSVSGAPLATWGRFKYNGAETRYGTASHWDRTLLGFHSDCFALYPAGTLAEQLAGLVPPMERSDARAQECPIGALILGDSGSASYVYFDSRWWLLGTVGNNEAGRVSLRQIWPLFWPTAIGNSSILNVSGSH